MEMEYETIASEYVDYGRKKFIEISKKRLLTENNENAVFLNISKGFYTTTGEKRYRGGIGFPPEEEIVNGIIEKLQSVMNSGDSGMGTDVEDIRGGKANPNADLDD
jgi:hypothetical protein